MITCDVSNNQLDLMKHAIGWNNTPIKHKILNAYRNRYFVYNASDKCSLWKDLESKGYAKYFYVDDSMNLYAVTTKGIKLLSSLYRVKINQDSEDIVEV